MTYNLKTYEIKTSQQVLKKVVLQNKLDFLSFKAKEPQDLETLRNAL